MSSIWEPCLLHTVGKVRHTIYQSSCQCLVVLVTLLLLTALLHAVTSRMFQAIITMTQLGIPDALEHGPKTSQQLATELKVHQPYLERLLRLCDRIGVVSITQPKASPTAAAAAAGSNGSSGSSGSKGTRESWSSSRVHISEGQLYHLTQLSAVLCESHVNSVKHMVLLFGDHFVAFSHLTEGIRSGQTPYKLFAGGLSHWEHMRKEPELYERFNK